MANSHNQDERTSGKKHKVSKVPPVDAFDTLPKRRPTNPYNTESLKRNTQSGRDFVQKGEENVRQAQTKNKGTRRNTKNIENAKSAQNSKKRKSSTKQNKQQPQNTGGFNDAKHQDKENKKPNRVKRELAASEKNKGSLQKPISNVKRRRNRRITAVVLTFLVVVVGIIVSVRVIFKIEKFSVVLPEDTQMIYTEQEIEQAFIGQIGDGLFSFNAENAQERIKTALPYIDDITIRRKFPNTVVFRVTPAVESYYVQVAENQYAILSGNLKVLKLTDSVPDNLTYIHGAGEITAVAGTPLTFTDESKASALNSILETLRGQGITDVNWIDISNLGMLSFRWQHRFTILIGSTVDIGTKVEYAMFLIHTPEQSGLTDGDSGTLDVSPYPSGNASYRPGDGARW